MPKNKGSKLTHTFVKSIARSGRYGDGRGGLGLSLLVKPTADGRWSKSWSQRIRIGETVHSVGLGSFPVVTLAMARDKVIDNAHRTASGEDILHPTAEIPTFSQAFETVLALRSQSWKNNSATKHWRQSKERCKPIDSKLITEITSPQVRRLITPIWIEKPASARRLRSHIALVMDWAMAEDYRTTNPAGPEITRTLPKQPKPVSAEQIPYPELGTALAAIRDADAWWAQRACLLFIALTCARSNEARNATWDEIDLTKSLWTLPEDRMKNGYEQLVPLSTQAKELLLYAREQNGSNQGIIFPSAKTNRRISENTLNVLLDRLQIPMVTHGIRGTFYKWTIANHSRIPAPAADMCLAHRQKEAVRRSYGTDTFIEHRTPAMQWWADYLAETMGHILPTSGN